MHRRAFLLAGTSVLAAAAVPAFAQEVTSQAEWRQNYDEASRMRVPRSSTPLLSQQALAATEEMIEHYRDFVARGGWTSVQASENLRLGANNPAVIALRKRLIVTGDLDPAAGSSPVYDSYVVTAVRRFQARHGLNMTGALSSATIAAMNVPAEARLRQLELNAVRLRAYSGNLGRRYVVVNIPGASVETVEDGVVATRHAAGVGKIDRQSPLLNSKITEVNFNPFWTAPASVIKKDLIPKMQKEPNYLTENKIRIFDAQGQELRPSQVNWHSNEATRYRFRQDPSGDLNSMGYVRINIPNVHGVYMHDTPSKGIFGDESRFVSSGCVRLQNVRDYVRWLLKETPGWDREQIEATFQSGDRIDAKLADVVNVYWTYITAWATPDGLAQFRDDIYRRDGLGIPVAQVNSAPSAEQDVQLN